MINYSIIIPHKNTQKLLQRCLNSIPKRNDLEIIVVDDNSNPDVVNFNNFPGKERIHTKIIFTKEEKGAGYARNIGMKHATGKWILFADADDFFLENIIDILDIYNNSESNIILFKTQCRLSNNISLEGNRQTLCNTWNNLIDQYNKGNISSKEILSKVIVPWGKMIKKDFLLEHDITFEEIPVANDVIWSTYLSLNISNNDFIASPHTIYCLTENPNSLFNNKNRQSFLTRFEVLHRQKKILEQYKIEGFEKINYNFYLTQAQKLGIITLLKSIYISIKYNHSIDSIYKVEKKLSFKFPYFYFFVIILQCIYYNLIGKTK